MPLNLCSFARPASGQSHRVLYFPSSVARVQRQSQNLLTANPADLQQQIDDLLAQDPDSPLIVSLYNSLGQAYERQFRYTGAEVAYRNAAQRREQ